MDGITYMNSLETFCLLVLVLLLSVGIQKTNH